MRSVPLCWSKRCHFPIPALAQKNHLCRSITDPEPTKAADLSHGSFLQVDVVVKSLFERSLCANSVQINVPVPPQTAKVNIKKSKGDAKYDGSLGVIRWNISKFSGQKQHTLSADVVLVSTTREKKTWNRCDTPVHENKRICTWYKCVNLL